MSRAVEFGVNSKAPRRSTPVLHCCDRKSGSLPYLHACGVRPDLRLKRELRGARAESRFRAPGAVDHRVDSRREPSGDANDQGRCTGQV